MMITLFAKYSIHLKTLGMTFEDSDKYHLSLGIRKVFNNINLWRKHHVENTYKKAK